MYKLHLCLRYLRSRVIAYFAILCVALCVAMMLIVISVMNGFLDKIETATKGLFGDIVLDTTSLNGLGYYDEFIEQVRKAMPEKIEAASPFVQTYAILQVPKTDHRQVVTLVGIRLPQRARVSTFAQGLFVQKNWPDPTFDPPIPSILDTMRGEHQRTEGILDRLTRENAKKPSPATEDLIRQVRVALSFQQDDMDTLRQAEPYQKALEDLQKQLEAARMKAETAPGQGQELQAEVGKLTDRMSEEEDAAGLQAPERRMILGLGLPALSFRTPAGDTVRNIGPGHQIVLTLIPVSRQMLSLAKPETAAFSVVDDCQTDVWSIDSNVVYIPFETLQRLNNIGPEYGQDGKLVSPARCSQIHFKVKPAFEQRSKLKAVANELRDQWLAFESQYPKASLREVSVETWWERNARIIGPIQQQRTLVVIMFAVVSGVAVVLIFVIFYMIVMQKTKDIGVLKAVGASSGGVAGIFFLYAAAIGLVGSVLGSIGGYYFVRNINAIRDASEKYLGFGVWSKEWYLFERIPNTVNLVTAVQIVIAAVLASMLGAMIPAIRAARMQPVEALRYE